MIEHFIVFLLLLNRSSFHILDVQDLSQLDTLYIFHPLPVGGLPAHFLNRVIYDQKFLIFDFDQVQFIMIFYG